MTRKKVNKSAGCPAERGENTMSKEKIFASTDAERVWVVTRNTIVLGIVESIVNYFETGVAMETDKFHLGLAIAMKIYSEEECEELLIECWKAAQEEVGLDDKQYEKIMFLAQKNCVDSGACAA